MRAAIVALTLARRVSIRGVRRSSWRSCSPPSRGKPADWLALFKAELPDLEVRVAPDVGNPDDIEYAAIAALPHGQLKTFKNLRMIASLLAGADVLLSDPELPRCRSCAPAIPAETR